VLDFVFEIAAQRQQAGGTFHALIGNHEIFGGRLDNQAISDPIRFRRGMGCRVCSSTLPDCVYFRRTRALAARR
jgi:hypothetical protein